MKISLTETDALIQMFYEFLKSIHIRVVEKKIDENTFLPGLKIEGATLVVDREKLLYPGDILHEAGHIAVSSPQERDSLHGNLTDNKPEKGGEEFAVMLWSYAACLHLKIDPEIVFHKDGYKGSSSWILENYKDQSYMGLPLLVWMGMTENKDGNVSFPKMKKWLRE